MRYSHLVAACCLFLLPISALAAENSGSQTASTASNGAANFSAPSAGTPNTFISTSSSDLSDTAAGDPNQLDPNQLDSNQRSTNQRSTNQRSGEQDQVIAGKSIIPVKSSFQLYVESSTGKLLDVFGRDLFRNVPSTFAPLKAVQVNADYVIGPGDALQIRGWGMVDIDVNVTVSRSGEIYLPRVGSVRVAGVKYRDLQGYLKKAVGKIFKSFELSASIAQTRSVQIYVVGHALRPGSYSLSAMSTMLNALFASGGPAVTGSMRNIKLKRGGAGNRII